MMVNDFDDERTLDEEEALEEAEEQQSELSNLEKVPSIPAECSFHNNECLLSQVTPLTQF